MNPSPSLWRTPFVLVIALALLLASTATAYQAKPAPTCTTVKAYVVALDRPLVLNRFGSTMPGGMIYALARDVFPNGLKPDEYTELNSCRFALPLYPNPEGKTCNAGYVQLRPDAPALPGKRPRPLVLRANQGDCLEIHFANLLSLKPLQVPALESTPAKQLQPSTRAAGVHVQGLSWVDGPQDDASNVGNNGSSLVPPPTSPTTVTAVYRLYAEHEGPYLLYNTADDWTKLPDMGGGDGGTLAEGLFGAVNVEPSGHQDWQSEFYRSQVSEQDLCLASTDKGGDALHCERHAPHSLPVMNYQALYPKAHPRAYLPILNMVCSKRLTPDAIGKVCEEGELVHGDLTAMITGRSAKDPRLPHLPPQPQAFPDDEPADKQPPSLRPIYAYPDRFQPFREFTIIYHESFQVTQAFQAQINGVNNGKPTLPSLQAAQDNFGINYGMAGLSNEVLANRLGGGDKPVPGAGPLQRCVDCKYEEFFLSSWAMGDPAMNVYPPANACTPSSTSPDCSKPRALFPDDPSNVYHGYVSDHVRFRVLHAGADLHHLHHQHAQQWLGTPNSPDGDYLDSQSIGPGSAFTMEMVYNGSGNVNQTVGDSIFHCHFYPHFASGMWSLWRVHDVFEGGTILGDDGRPCDRPCQPGAKVRERTRALPDGEIREGTPTVALVPLPTLPMAPMPAAVRLQGVCKDKPATNCLEDKDCGAAGSCTEMGSRYCVVQGGLGKSPETCISEFQTTPDNWAKVKQTAYPGYPFFIPGIGGSRPPHPPLDFAYACAKSGRICDPTIKGVEGLQPAASLAYDLHLLAQKPLREWTEYQAPIFRDPVFGEQTCTLDEGECEPMDGGLPRAVTAQGLKSDWRSLQTMKSAPANEYQNLDFSKEIERANAIELPEVGTQLEKVSMKVHAQRFHDTQLPDGRKTGICSDNRAPCTSTDRALCGNPANATCTPGRINFILNGLGPKPGAPYADPCIRFDRNGGQPKNMLPLSYLAADLQLDAIFNREGWHFPQQRMLSLWGDVKDFLDRKKPPEPLFMRVNSYDCMTYVLANLVPNVYEQDDFQVRTPTDVIGQHIHLVKFDVTSSDGAENGWNYEDGTYGPNEVTERIKAIDKKGGIFLPPGKKNEPGEKPCTGGSSDQRCLEAKYIKFFGPGPGAAPNPSVGSETSGAWLGSQATVQRWYDDPLFNNTGRCSTDLRQPCTLGQELAGLTCPNNGTCVTDAGFCQDVHGDSQNCTQSDRHLCCTQLDRKICKAHASHDYYDPDYYSSCEPSHDRTIRTVFTHDHFGPSTHQQGGLYAGVVAEPKGSVWRNNQTGEIMGGYDAVVNRNYSVRTATENGVSVKDGGPTSWQAVIETPNVGDSFREFLLEVQDSTLLYAPFQVGGNPMALLRPDACAIYPSEPCGFCSLTGRCSDTNKPCQMPPFAGTVTSSGCNAGANCLFGLNPKDANQPYLVACTPEHLDGTPEHVDGCAQPSVESCNFIPGVPSPAWTPINGATAKVQKNTLSGPIDAKGVEAITFKGSTNSFSFNYRDEPLYPRIDSAPSSPTSVPKPLQGGRGDLAFVYSSLQFCEHNSQQVCSEVKPCPADDNCVNRDNPRGGRCSLNLNELCDLKGKSNTCSSGTGSCEEVGFCSDNYALCLDDNKTLCVSSAATCLAKRISIPYRPLTAGIEETDPFTPLLRGYAGDDVQLRVLIGAHINPHNFTLHGLNWLNQPSYVDSGWRNSQAMGISEHYNLLVKLDPKFIPSTAADTSTPPLKPWMDYLYQPGAAAIEQAAGNWGLIRAYDERRKDLWPLPQNNYSPGTPFKEVPVCPADAPSRDYTVVALSAQQALGSGGLVYNPTQKIGDTGALLFFDMQNPGLKCTVPQGWSTCTFSGKPDPLVLRAAAGECIHVKLYNGLPNDSPKVEGVPSAQVQVTTASDTSQLKPYTSNVSQQVGLRPQLVTTDPRFSDGTNAGFNPPQTASPGGPPVTYTWYAGHIEPEYIPPDNNPKNDIVVKHIPIEFGAANLLPPDPLNHALHGLFGGLIIEPEGATWKPAPGNSVSPVNAYVHYRDYTGEEHDFYEFVVFTEDDTNLKSTPASTTAGAFNLINYSTEVLKTNNTPPRSCTNTPCPATDVSCVLTTVSTAKSPLYCQCQSSNGCPSTGVNCVLNDQLLCQCPGPPPSSATCAPCTTTTAPNSCACPSCNFTPATPTFVARVGKEVRFRLLHPGGTNTNEVFELAGHTYLQTPYETPPDPVIGCKAPTTHTNLFSSKQMGEKNLCGSLEFLPKEKVYRDPKTGKTEKVSAYRDYKTFKWGESLSEWKASRSMHGPSNHFDVLIHEAGGPFHLCGDYLYRSYPADHFDLGIWGILRVDCSPPSGSGTGGGAGAGGK